MAHSKTFNILSKQIGEIKAIDAHTHINASCMSARGLHDIMLYHMVISELYSAGCPSGQRLSDNPDDSLWKIKILKLAAFIVMLSPRCFVFAKQNSGGEVSGRSRMLC
jgi:hypothetical protein